MPKYGKIQKAIGRQLEYIKKDIDSSGRFLLQAGVDILPEKRLVRVARDGRRQ
jgi:hypothetical protein